MLVKILSKKINGMGHLPFSVLYVEFDIPVIFVSFLRYWQTRTHCCRHIAADTNVSPFARARNICCGHKFCVRDTKMFLILFRNILCPQQMFPSLRSPRNIMSNNVSATMCSRLPVPLEDTFAGYTCKIRHQK